MAEAMALASGYALEFGENIPAEAVEKAKALYAKFREDSAAQELIAKAQSVEEAYDAVVSYVDCTLDEFREIFNAAAHRAYDLKMEAAGPKEELTEEELDTVAGGSFWGWVKRNVRAIVDIAIGVATTVLGIGAVAVGISGVASGYGAVFGVATIGCGVGVAGMGISMIVQGVKKLN